MRKYSSEDKLRIVKMVLQSLKVLVGLMLQRITRNYLLVGRLLPKREKMIILPLSGRL